MSEELRVDFSEVKEMMGDLLGQGVGKCKSCDTPWVDHLGVQGICRKLQRAELRAKALYDMMKLLHDTAESALKHMGEDE